MLRQHDPAERQALEALHDGHPAAYLEHKQPDLTVHDSEDGALSEVVAQWHDAQRAHGLAGAVMIARDNHTRKRLNHAARQRLKDDGSLPGQGVVVGNREFAAGDRIIARRNDRHADIDNGTLATLLEIDDRAHRMIIQTDRGHQRELDLAYVHRHVEHAYALTGHGAQGATVEWAAIIGRPDELTREWAYTALSRARQSTRLHVISQANAHDQERQQYAPEPADQAPVETIAALPRAMARSETEPLAIDHDHQALIRALGHHASSQLENTPIVGRLPPRSPSTRPAMLDPEHSGGRSTPAAADSASPEAERSDAGTGRPYPGYGDCSIRPRAAAWRSNHDAGETAGGACLRKPPRFCDGARSCGPAPRQRVGTRQAAGAAGSRPSR